MAVIRGHRAQEAVATQGRQGVFPRMGAQEAVVDLHMDRRKVQQQHRLLLLHLRASRLHRLSGRTIGLINHGTQQSGKSARR